MHFFSEIGIRVVDFLQISAGFMLTMLVFFGLKDKKHSWLNYLLTVGFAFQCLLVVLFHQGNVRFFAAIMLISALTIEGIATLRTKPALARK